MVAEGQRISAFESQKPTPLCSAVVVSIYSYSKLPVCLDVLKKHGAFGQLEVIVVNNSRDDQEDVSRVCDERGVAYVQNASNIGFGRACNMGARQATGEFLMFLSPDVRISHESVSMLLKLAKANETIVAIGPLQRSSSGPIYGKRRVVGQPSNLAASPIRSVQAAEALLDTKFLSCGALLVRKSAFDQIGGFDSQLFLFHEDDDLCLRLSALGQLAYAAGVVALHDWGTSTPALAKVTYARSWHLGFSKVHVLRKHHGKQAASRVLIEAALKFISPALLTGRGRIKARAFLAGTLAALRNPDLVAEMVPA